MKPKLIFKSPAEIPTHALSPAPSLPGRAVNLSKQVPGPAGGATRREIRGARTRSAQFARDIRARAHAPFPLILPGTAGE